MIWRLIGKLFKRWCAYRPNTYRLDVMELTILFRPRVLKGMEELVVGDCANLCHVCHGDGQVKLGRTMCRCAQCLGTGFTDDPLKVIIEDKTSE